MSKDLQKTDKKDLTNSKSGKIDFASFSIDAFAKTMAKTELPRLFYQLVIFIIDGSNSMNEKSRNGISKAEEIDNSINSVVKRLRNSRNSNSFDISFITFSDDYSEVIPLTNVPDISQEQSFNPLTFVEPKGTKLNQALLRTKEIVSDYHKKNTSKNCQVLIQILSDGEIKDYSDAIGTINNIKAIDNTSIACQFIESHIEDGQQWYSWNEATGEVNYDNPWSIEDVRLKEKRIASRFKDFASNPDMFVTSIDPEEIRKHMIKSISTVSRVLEGSTGNIEKIN